MPDNIIKQENKYDELNKTGNNYQEAVAQAQNPNGITEVNPSTGTKTTREATAADAKSNTGSGIEAAVGTDYSWNKQGNEKAQKTYSSDVLTAKQNLLNNRQTMETNAVNYQTQADMMKYQNNQNAEKVGWTGGYVLDQNRQMDYLKASIQAQMYGAMELQKYGYDSSLAAARLSYDLNQQEYARQYYQDAVSASLSEAQLTGTYFSAETKDMMNQLSVADDNLKRIGAIDDDGKPVTGFDPEKLSADDRAAYDKANTVKDSIKSWFKSNNISEQGVKTLEAWSQEQANELQWSQELWTRYQAARESAKTDISENASEFIMLDENGREVFDGNNIATGNWDTMDGQAIIDYANTSVQAANQFYSYLDSTITGEVESGFNKWCKTNGYITTDDSGNTVTKSGDYIGLLKGYLEDAGVINKFKEKFANVSATEAFKMISNWDFTIQLPDGRSVTATYKQLSDGTFTSTSAIKPGQATQVSGSSQDAAGNTVSYTWDNASTNLLEKEGALGANCYKTTLTTGSLSGKKISVTTAKADIEKDKIYRNQNDIGVQVYKDEKVNSNSYDTEFEEDYPSIQAGSQEFAEITSFIKKMSGSAIQEGQIIVIDDTAYCYHEVPTHMDNKKGGGIGLYKLGGQCGKEDLYNELSKTGQLP